MTPFTLAEAKDVLANPVINRLMWRTPSINSTDWDIPNLVGYSQDGLIIFIDRSLGAWQYRDTTVPMEPFLALRGRSEKSVIDALATAQGRELQRLLILLKMTHADDDVYPHARGVAAALEEYAVRMQYGQVGFDYYSVFLHGQDMK